ncbi:MAG: hypothetical protein VKL41_00340, partial [Snowella sp.]|nr:hypothetical protein [Snowella sp.]
PQPTVSTDLFDNTPSVAPSFGLQLELVTPTGTITKTDFTPLTLDERGIVTNGGLFNRTLD